jgi:hypothetical protein
MGLRIDFSDPVKSTINNGGRISDGVALSLISTIHQLNSQSSNPHHRITRNSPTAPKLVSDLHSILDIPPSYQLLMYPNTLEALSKAPGCAERQDQSILSHCLQPIHFYIFGPSPSPSSLFPLASSHDLSHAWGSRSALSGVCGEEAAVVVEESCSFWLYNPNKEDERPGESAQQEAV